MSFITMPAGGEVLPEACKRCGGPAPELVGFCLHCGSGSENVPRKLDDLVHEDKQRWERENSVLLKGLVGRLPGPLAHRLEDRLRKRQQVELELIEKQAKEVEKLREELELPVSDLSFAERSLMLVSGRRAARRWRRNKSRVSSVVRPVRQWGRLVRSEGLRPALARLPFWSQFCALFFLLTWIASDLTEPFVLLSAAALIGGMYQRRHLLGPAADLDRQLGGMPGGLLGRERIERIRTLVSGRRSRRLVEPVARLLTALAQAVRLTKRHPQTIGAVVGDLSQPICELVDLAISFGNKAALLEEYLAREQQDGLETELARLEQRLLQAGPEGSEDLLALRRKKEAILLKRLDLDRQLEQLLTRLSLTAAEAEDLLAALYRLSAAQNTSEHRQPSEILSDLRNQLQAMEELFPTTA